MIIALAGGVNFVERVINIGSLLPVRLLLGFLVESVEYGSALITHMLLYLTYTEIRSEKCAKRLESSSSVSSVLNFSKVRTAAVGYKCCLFHFNYLIFSVYSRGDE